MEDISSEYFKNNKININSNLFSKKAAEQAAAAIAWETLNKK